jgi:UDP-glucose 4-epimerase
MVKGYNITIIDSLITGNKQLVPKEAKLEICDISDTIKVINCLNNLIETNIKVEIGPRREADSECIVSNPEKFIKIMSWRPKFNNLKYILETAISREEKLNK